MRALITFLFALLLAAGNTIAQPGAIDHTFNPGDFGFGYGDGPNGEISSMILQSDGQLLIGGSFTTVDGIPRHSIARISPDGSLDLTFDPGTGANGPIFSISIQNDNKIIIGGSFSTYNGYIRNNIARLNIDGSLDTSFNTGIGANAAVRHLLIQNDGNIIIAGDFTQFNAVAKDRICRINVNGILDDTYSGNIQSTAINSITSLCFESDGNLLVGGNSGGSGTSIARLWPNGNYINQILVSGPSSSILAIHTFDNGDILIGGGGYSNTGTVPIFKKLNSSGSTILTFAPNGGPNGHIYNIIVLPNDKILISGDFTQYSGIPINRLARLNMDGTIDPSFSQNYNYRIGEKIVVNQDESIIATG